MLITGVKQGKQLVTATLLEVEHLELCGNLWHFEGILELVPCQVAIAADVYHKGRANMGIAYGEYIYI